uniref:Uncharacterized protein n=1 Tax=Acrobeloides nanus TaxID=290746 RepID=A0A914DXC9_9BILA
MNFIKKFGFWIERQPSKLTNGGIGVIVTHGSVPINTLVGLYPGTVYKIGEPIFLQSIANSFVFRCADGTLIDGNDMGISKIIFRSCTFRDRIGPHLTSDMTWLTSYPVNPLNTGQYVNNHTQENPANVMYQEINLPLKEFPYKLRKFIPNIPPTSRLSFNKKYFS